MSVVLGKEDYLNKRIKDLGQDLRPDEKFLKYGAQALSDAELLAIIIRSGSADEHCIELADKVLSYNSKTSSLLNIYNLSIDDLMSLKGIGKVKALQIKAVFELSKRIAKTVKKKSLVLNNPKTIAEYFYEELRHLNNEQVILLMVDSAGNLLKEKIMSKGTVNVSLLSAREIFCEALKEGAVNIILLHNHPSGEITPSKMDINCTKKIKDAGDIIGIKLLDHIIIGDRKYLSFREENIVV